MTVPCTSSLLPTATSADGALPVKTNRPSDVAGSPSSSPSGVWMKKPLFLRPVTMPLVATGWFSWGERSPLPWMAWIGSVVTSSLRMVTTAWPLATSAPATLLRLTWKISSGSTFPSPTTSTSIVSSRCPCANATEPERAM